MNQLYYGDNLEILRRHIQDETVDLCYIDPPFNSKRNYNQIYLNIGEDKAQAQPLWIPGHGIATPMIACVKSWIMPAAYIDILDD
jgi:DNA modification methylase